MNRFIPREIVSISNGKHRVNLSENLRFSLQLFLQNKFINIENHSIPITGVGDAQPIQCLDDLEKDLPSPNSDMVLECLKNVLKERLTQKQKKILLILRENKTENITRTVKIISDQLKCSESCIWNNINSLKRCKLIENEKNKPVRLSSISLFILGDTDEL